MTGRNLVKLGLTACLMAFSALPARAALIPVTEYDGTNFNYSATVATVAPGVETLTINYIIPSSLGNFVTQINGNPVALQTLFTGTPPTLNPMPPPAYFAYTTVLNNVTATSTGVSAGTSDTAAGIDPITGLPNGMAGGNVGINDTTGVESNYLINSVTGTSGNVTDALTLTGTINLDTVNFPLNPTTYTVGLNTYDFSTFTPGNLFATGAIITLNSSPGIVADILNGSGTFTGSGSFTFTATPTPEPASAMLLCVGGLFVAAASRRRKA